MIYADLFRISSKMCELMLTRWQRIWFEPAWPRRWSWSKRRMPMTAIMKKTAPRNWNNRQSYTFTHVHIHINSLLIVADGKTHNWNKICQIYVIIHPISLIWYPKQVDKKHGICPKVGIQATYWVVLRCMSHVHACPFPPLTTVVLSFLLFVDNRYST